MMVFIFPKDAISFHAEKYRMAINTLEALVSIYFWYSYLQSVKIILSGKTNEITLLKFQMEKFPYVFLIVLQHDVLQCYGNDPVLGISQELQDGYVLWLYIFLMTFVRMKQQAKISWFKCQLVAPGLTLSFKCEEIHPHLQGAIF